MEHAEDYDAKARRIAQELGLSVAIHKANPQRCPDWETPRDRFTRRMQCACGNVHGYLFAVTISRDGTAGAQSITFDFWGSKADAVKGYGPTWYDVLACVAADASSATTPDEVYEDFGPMKPSTANRIAEHTHRLRRFFTEAELDRLGDVDA